MNSPIRFSHLGQRTREPAISTLMQAALSKPGLISLAAGFVDQATLPIQLTAELSANLFHDELNARRALQYGTTRGHYGLRQQVIARLEDEEHVSAGRYEEAVERTVITTGSQQLLALTVEALLDEGDIVLVEAPTYFVFLGLLEVRGVRALGIETDDQGMRLDSLEETLQALDDSGELARVKLIYTISEHGNPTGLSLAAQRRRPLVEIARKWSRTQRILILEDAAYRGLSFDAYSEPPSVWSQDVEQETVILARTFSKTYSPGIKLGYGVLPKSLYDVVIGLKGNVDFGSANLNQMLMERVLLSGRYDDHVALVRAKYLSKRDCLLETLEDQLGDLRREGEVNWTCPLGGIYVWLSLPRETDTGPNGMLWKRCLDHGVIYVPGALAYPTEPRPAPNHQARLCYGVTNHEELVEGVRRLSAALHECLAPV